MLLQSKANQRPDELAGLYQLSEIVRSIGLRLQLIGCPGRRLGGAGRLNCVDAAIFYTAISYNPFHILSEGMSPKQRSWLDYA
jgi:hypothetical protein